MSEGGGGSGPDIGPNYQNAGPATYSNPPSQPPTPSSTVQDPPSYHSVEVNDNSNDSKPNITNLHSNSSASGLPPFSSFAASDVNEGLGGRLAGDGYLTSDGISSTRVMELSGWDYCYTDGLSGRYLERGDSMPVMIPQPQYRPWESKQDGSSDSNKSTLPSFQSQFGEELVTTLTTLTPAACSPAPSVQSPSLPSFHTLSAVNPRYPLVPAPVQAREIPSIQQQFLDERHIHLFQGPPGQNFALQPQNGLNGQTLTSLNNGTTLTTLNNAQYHPQIINNAQILPSGQIITPQSHHLLAPSSQIITSNGHIISSSGGQGLTVVSQNSTPTVLTVVKTEPVNIVELKSSSTEASNLTQLHHANFQNPLITQGQQMDSKFGLESPPRGVDGRKKERRKIRASSLESSNESDGAMSVESSGQVAAVSSTAGFKSPMTPGQITNEGDGMITDTGEKQTKKKRKRCGECIGCQRKDNCGDCAPCRNDKSHQICKMRRCEKLTEKKHLLAYNREDGGVSYRGRGRGRGRGSRGGCRGKSTRPGAHSAQVTSVVTEMNSTPGLVVGSGRDNVKIESGRVSSGSIPPNPNLTPTMAVPFYAGTEVWPASNTADPWTAQGQFIHQIDDIRYQHYPGYQATGYQQAGFITDQTSAFQPQYANSSNGNPSTSPAQGNVTPRSSGSYTQVHTPTPSPNPSTPHVNGHRNGINVHYIEENYVNGTSFSTDATMVPPASTTPNSRSSSGQLEGSETSNKTTNYMSGNEIPGYPLNSPQCQSSCNSSGYPGQSLQSEYGDQSANETSYQQVNSNANHVNKKSPSYTQPSPGAYQSYQNYNQISPEQHQKSPKPGMSPGSCHPSQKPSGMYPQNSPNSNPSPQSYQQISPGQNRNAGQYENRNPGNGNMYMEQQRHFNENYTGQSPQQFNSEYAPQNFAQSGSSQDKSSVNARIKSMIMNKHQMSQGQRPSSNYSASAENHLMSPNREMMSPNHQGPQMNAGQMMSPSNQLLPNNQIASPNSKDSKGYVQRNEYGEKKQGQMSENPNHFLAFSHHLRDGSVLQPEGGGVQNWADSIGPNRFLGVKTEYSEHQFGFTRRYGHGKQYNDGMSAMENIMKFASVDFDKVGVYAEQKPPQSEFLHGLATYEKHAAEIPDPIRNLEVNFPTRRNVNSMTLPGYGALKPESFNRLRDCRRRERVNPPLADSKSNNFIDKNQNISVYPPEQDHFGSFKAQNNLNAVNAPNGNNFYWYKDTHCQSNFKESTDWRTWNLKSEFPDTLKSEFPDTLKSEFPDIKTEEELSTLSDVDLSALKVECCDGIEYLCMKSEFFDPKMEGASSDSLYQRISYAPNAPNMEVIDLRFVKTESVNKEKWEEYQEAMKRERKGSGSAKREKESYLFEGDGGPIALEKATGSWCCRRGGIETPSAEHLRDGCCEALQTADEISPEKDKTETPNSGDRTGDVVTSQSPDSAGMEKNCMSPCQENGKELQENVERHKNNARSDVPDCQCFPPDKYPPEPGSYYTHLGAAPSLSQLRKDVETRTGQTGKALRIEKICYTGKEGKTTQGCPLAKWVIRRSSMDEKFLIVVKHRQGHTCATAWIVVVVVAWEGVPSSEADKIYTLLTHKLNRFGLPTTRRCATNEPRTCACQGLDPDTCGASFSFGCSWSMYYNGCKYARSKTVRKFRLSVRSEEQEVEERLHVLATLLSPLYNSLAPEAFHNQTAFEREASECRLGFKPGRPFSGVTACIDFCSHSHRDLHNMNNGCTVVVSLTKHRSLSKPEDEQLHVLPLYIMDETDEHGCRESQEEKYKNGSIECLKKFPCEVRVRAVPLQPCRRHGKKRKDEDVDAAISSGRPKDVHAKNSSPIMTNNNASPMHCLDVSSIFEGMDGQVQSSQVSSTVLDSPVGAYHGWNYHGMPENDFYSGDGQWNKPWVQAEAQRQPAWPYPHLSAQWDCCGYIPDHVHPDSTTHHQVNSPNRNSFSMNARSNMVAGNFANSPLATTWRQQVTENRNYPYGDCRFLANRVESTEANRDLGLVRNSKNSPLWSDCGMAPPNHGFDAVFRVPRGRAPSRPHHLPSSTVSEHSETFFKPFPRDNHSTSIYNSTKEADTFRDSWGSRNVRTCKFPFPETGTFGAVNFQNPFNSNQSALNPAENYHQINFPRRGCLGSGPFGYASQNYNNYVTENRYVPSGAWPEYLDERYSGYGCKQNCPPVQERWDPHRWNVYGQSPLFPLAPEAPKSEPIGQVIGFVDNEECFRDSQVGGVAIALSHGSVLFECAKHELHATTALRRPDRLHPTRISLVFYQHRNLNRAKHGWDEWEEKMRLRKLGIKMSPDKSSKDSVKEQVSAEVLKLAGLEKPLGLSERILVRVPTYTTTTWTTLFPMRPCMVTGPYQEGAGNC